MKATKARKRKRAAAVDCTDLLGAVVGINMIGYEGLWNVMKNEGARVLLQQPQDLKPMWVLRKYVQAPNDKLSGGDGH